LADEEPWLLVVFNVEKQFINFKSEASHDTYQTIFSFLYYFVRVFPGLRQLATKKARANTLTNTVITSKVKAAFVNDPDKSAVNVETFKGVVS
jgi:hypothetical protein